MNKQLRNSLTAREVIPNGETNTLPSCTEPDQTLTIKQIVERHTNGINLGVPEYEPYYSEVEMPNIEHMDFDQLHSYRVFLSEQRYALEDKLQEHKQEETRLRQIEQEEKLRKKIEKEKQTQV